MKKIKLNLTPLIFFTIALYVGEAGLDMIGIPIGISSSVMYLLLLIGIIIGVGDIKFSGKANCVYLLYIYILIRNLTLDKQLFTDYWLPNAMTLVLFFVIAGYCEKKENVQKLIDYSFAFLSILMALGCVKAIISPGRLAVFGGPNGYYKFALFFEAICFVRFMEQEKKIYLLFACIGIALSLLTGSKGAIISLCLIIPLEYWYFFAGKGRLLTGFSKKLFVLLLIVFSAVLALMVVKSLFPSIAVTVERAISLFTSDDASQITSVNAREGLLALSWHYFLESPIIGKGAMYLKFDTLHTSDPQPYAHNVFFEMLGEQGIIGFILLLIILLTLLKGFKKRYLVNDRLYFLLYMAFLVYFLGAQFSGNILDSKVFLLYSMVIIIYKRRFVIKKNPVLHEVSEHQDKCEELNEEMSTVNG